jgi:aldehyde dehydrogenase (NAD+)
VTTTRALPLDQLPESVLLIGSERIDSSSAEPHQHRYPGSGELTRAVILAGAAEIDRAVQAARRALPEWRAIPLNQRRSILLRVAAIVREHADELTLLTIMENGTALPFAQAYAELVADLFEYNAGWVDKITGDTVPTWPVPALDYTVHEPYGVVGIIIPWNSPLGSAGMTMPLALAAGNCVVMKPPEIAPWSVIRLGELMLEAGMPPGVVNVVPAGPEGGDALVRHPGVDFVHFTGSGATAKIILKAAAETLKPIGLELGGKSPRIIFDDGDLDGAVAETIGNLGVLAGQGCIFGMRVLAHADIYDEFVEKLASAAEQIPVGDPFEPGTVMGPVATDAAMQRILGIIERARADGRRARRGLLRRADGVRGCGPSNGSVAKRDLRPGRRGHLILRRGRSGRPSE